MHNTELLLLGIIFLYPALDLILERFTSQNKIVEYLKTATILWLITGLLVYTFFMGELSVVKFDYVVVHNWQNLTAILMLLVAIIYLVLLIKSISSNERLSTEVLSKFAPFMALMPNTKQQILVFTVVLSGTAGICEELIFRAYLYNFVDSYLGVIGAIIISSLVFGFWHIYLGWTEVLRTSLMGGFFCAIYLFTGNIIFPILLHIFIDIYSGLICYFAQRAQHQTHARH